MTTLAGPQEEARTVAPSSRRRNSPEFEFVFPAIRGVQAGHEYYVTMCPLRLIPRIFTFDEEELVPELRAQRTLNKARVPEIARYILANPMTYVFSALTASVDAPMRFDPVGEGGTQERVGALTIPMSAHCLINDGQHRRAAIQQALLESPEIGDESIAIVLFLDVGLERCQQMFADLNRYAVRPGKSLGVLYDHRDQMSAITRLALYRTPALRSMTDMERSNLSARSRKLFTLSGIHTATRALLDGLPDEPNVLVDLAVAYWEAVMPHFPEWLQVSRGTVSAGDIRRDFIHSHGIVLHALGNIGNTLLGDSREPKRWQRYLKRLEDIDWRRDNAALWEGRAMVDGRVSKNSVNVLLTTSAIHDLLGLSPRPEGAGTINTGEEPA
jgi:DNA sulfur modification protein DndB